MSTDVFGYIRFSYLGRSDVKLARNLDDIEQRKAILYAPQRMETRLYYFEKICLPSLRWQKDQDFRVAIFTSPEMPQVYRKRLEALVAGIPQIEIVTDSAPHITFAVNDWIAKQESVQQRPTVHFRLDDDDALASDTIGTLRRSIPALPDGGLVTRPFGLFLMNGPDGPEILAKFEPNIAIGFALVNPPRRIHQPYALQHGRFYQQADSLMLPTSLAYIHTAHAESDTVDAQGRKLALARAAHSERFGARVRRFRLAVKAQFGGRPLEHFLEILRRAPDAPPLPGAPLATLPDEPSAS